MRVEPVEIYSDKTNGAVMRHPGRTFPGILIQGDNLHDMCLRTDRLCADLRPQIDAAAYAELNRLRNTLWAYLSHYRDALVEHGIKLPYSDQ
jgi:uncharacterized protein DUF6959